MWDTLSYFTASCCYTQRYHGIQNIYCSKHTSNDTINHIYIYNKVNIDGCKVASVGVTATFGKWLSTVPRMVPKSERTVTPVGTGISSTEPGMPCNARPLEPANITKIHAHCTALVVVVVEVRRAYSGRHNHKVTSAPPSRLSIKQTYVKSRAIIMSPPPGGGIMRWCCLTSVMSLSHTSGLSREQRGLGRLFWIFEIWYFGHVTCVRTSFCFILQNFALIG